MAQFQTWLACQVCGRVTATNKAKHWLNEKHRTRWDIRIVRCPQHWSEWALRHTQAGRTKGMRARMREALEQPPPPFPVHIDPFPTQERRK